MARVNGAGGASGSLWGKSDQGACPFPPSLPPSSSSLALPFFAPTSLSYCDADTNKPGGGGGGGYHANGEGEAAWAIVIMAAMLMEAMAQQTSHTAIHPTRVFLVLVGWQAAAVTDSLAEVVVLASPHWRCRQGWWWQRW